MSLLEKKKKQKIELKGYMIKRERERYISFVFHGMDQEDFLPPHN
jgi:hypothetical protein